MRAFMALRLALGAAAAVLVLVVLAATGCGGNEASSGPSAPTLADGAASAVAGETLSDLIARPDVSFEVTFEWVDLYAGTSGYFVWRQGNGTRRWDVVQFESGQPSTGSFSIETEFSPGSPLGGSGEGCFWYAVGSPPSAQVQVGCGWGSWSDPVFGAVAGAVSSQVTAKLSDQTIAGRPASCYTFNDPRFSETALCLDTSQGIPLALVAKSSMYPNMSQAMHALSVSMTDQNLTIPIELKEDPRTGMEQAEAAVPISTLQLPDLSQFQQ